MDRSNSQTLKPIELLKQFKVRTKLIIRTVQEVRVKILYLNKLKKNKNK